NTGAMCLRPFSRRSPSLHRSDRNLRFEHGRRSAVGRTDRAGTPPMLASRASGRGRLDRTFSARTIVEGLEALNGLACKIWEIRASEFLSNVTLVQHRTSRALAAVPPNLAILGARPRNLCNTQVARH